MPSLNFKGKALVQNFHLLVPYHELKPVKSKSLTAKVSLHDNLVVHGDNLKALKSLLPYYHGKVKCIYIDPLPLHFASYNFCRVNQTLRVTTAIEGGVSDHNWTIEEIIDKVGVK
jgi:hypothetical protein